MAGIELWYTKLISDVLITRLFNNGLIIQETCANVKISSTDDLQTKYF